MTSFWTTEKIAKVLSLTPPTKSGEIITITSDSRAVKAGALFVAIKGDTHDGHDYIESAIKAGASCILTEKPHSNETVPVFQVPSTLAAIRTLAHHYRKTFTIPMIAVVGAVGKTTTKELIASLLQGKLSQIHKTAGSENGFLGIPLTLLKMDPKTEIAIIEIGIDEIGAMEQHLALVEPTHVILSKIGPEHLHQLKTVEIAASEELKAFDWGKSHQLPLAVNLSDEFVNAWLQKNKQGIDAKNRITYSLHSSDQPDILGGYDPENNLLRVTRANETHTYSLPLPGQHHAHNLLAAISLCSFFNLNPTELKKGLETFKTAYGRTEIYSLTDSIEIIGDHYNSNPSSLEAALQLLCEKKDSSAYHAVLGDMLELGDEEERFHREMAPSIQNLGVSHVWLYGKRMLWLKDELKKNNFKKVQHFETHEALLDHLKANLQANSRVLIKGSRGMKMEKILTPLIQKN